MDAEAETKLCPHCKHQIISTNFSLHTVHCQRSLTLCPKCDETIPRTQISEHMESAHKEVLCPSCHVPVENCQLERHQSELCTKRLIKCEYCEVDCHAGELQEHEDYCGSRTELCETCGQYILIKDEAVHIASGHAPKDRNRNKQDNVLTSKEAVETAFNASATNRPKVPNINRDSAARQSPTKRSNDMPQINTRASLNTQKESAKPAIADMQSKREALDQLLALHLAGSLDDMDPADIPFLLQNDTFSRDDDDRVQSLLHSTGSVFPPEFDEPDSLWDYNTGGFLSTDGNTITDQHEQSTRHDAEALEWIPCEFCGEQCSMENIIQHESGCRPDVVHGSPKEELNNTQSVVPSHLNSSHSVSTPVVENIDTEPSSVHSPSLPMSFDEDLIPCEICGEHYPSELLNEHQSVCPAKEDFSNVRYDLPEADQNFHEAPIDSSSSRSTEVSNNQAREVNFYPLTPDEDMLPCEICGEVFPSEILIEHQNFCANFKDPVQETSADGMQSEEQSTPKDNLLSINRVQNGLLESVEKPNAAKVAETNKANQPYHTPPIQHVKFGPLPNQSSYRQPRLANSPPALTRQHIPRIRNVPVSVAADYPNHGRTYTKDSNSYFKNSKENVRVGTDTEFEKSSPAVNSYVRETRKALNPVKEALRQETTRQNMRNSGTGTRPKNQTTRDDASCRTNRQQHQSDAHFSRYSHNAPRRDTEPNIPSYLQDPSGNLEEAFKTFLAGRTVPPRIGQYRSVAATPHQRTVAQVDRRPAVGHDHNSRLPPIVGMGAVPKKKDSKKTNDE